MRYLVLGDIHSNYVALEKCIYSEINNGFDGIIMTGDYISDCPFPQKTLRTIYELKKNFPLWLIKGNREDYQIMHAKGKLPFWTQNSSTGSLLYTYQNLLKSDIRFFEMLDSKKVIKLENGKNILLFHGTPTTNRVGIDRNTLDAKNYIENCDEKMILCAHTHKQFIYKVNGKTLVNPGSIGLPLESSGDLQYAIIEWRDNQWHAELKTLCYDKNLILKDFQKSGLEDMAPIYVKVIKEELKTGIDYMPQTLKVAQQIMHEHTFKGNILNLPEECWEIAYRKVVLKE